MPIFALQLIAPYLVYVAVSLFSSCVQPIEKAPSPRSAYIPGTKPPKCCFYLPGPDTGSEGGNVGAGWTGSMPSVQAALNWGHTHGYYTYFGGCESGPSSPIGPSSQGNAETTPKSLPATSLATTNNDVSSSVKKVKQKVKKGSIAKKRAGELLLQAGQFYNSVNEYVDLKPGDSQTPPAPKVVQQLTQLGTALASEVVTVPLPQSEFLTEGTVEARSKAVPGSRTFTVSPTPAPKISANPDSILSAGQAIIEKADSL